MIRVLARRALLVLLVLATSPAAIQAQPPIDDAPIERAEPQEPAAAPDTNEAIDEQDERRNAARPVLRVGASYMLREGDVAREVLVITGSTTIAGRVYQDVVCIAGTVRLTGTAVVDGELVVTPGHPLDGVAPGQTAVIYVGTRVLGQFTIDRTVSAVPVDA